jgi:hypothetical protein
MPIALSANLATVGPVERSNRKHRISWNASGADLCDFRYVFDFDGFTGGGHINYVVGISFKPSQENLVDLFKHVNIGQCWRTLVLRHQLESEQFWIRSVVRLGLRQQ